MPKQTTDHHDKKMLIIDYDTDNLKNTDKVRFYYALRGRDGSSGVLGMYYGEYIGTQMIMLPHSKADDMELFFNRWKVRHKTREITLHKEVQVAYDG